MASTRYRDNAIVRSHKISSNWDRRLSISAARTIANSLSDRIALKSDLVPSDFARSCAMTSYLLVHRGHVLMSNLTPNYRKKTTSFEYFSVNVVELYRYLGSVLSVSKQIPSSSWRILLSFDNPRKF